MKYSRHVAFHYLSVRLLDEDLFCVIKVPWKDQMPDIDPVLKFHSTTGNHKDWECKGFVVTFKIDPNKINQVPRKSTYNKCFANDPTF